MPTASASGLPAPTRSLPLRQAATGSPPPWLDKMAAIVGAEHVLSSVAERWAYARDRLPYATFHVRDGLVPGTLPSAVVCPADVDEVAQVVQLAAHERIGIIPFGAGSGVLGGTLPLRGELIVDLKRMNRILAIDEIDAVVTVQAGMNGGQFEAELNAKGWTSGHLPQSLNMSTVGGWAACRGAGQNSTRFGKIEDIVSGLSVILPDGRPLQVRSVARRAVGPSLKDLFIGSEGALGIITELTLKLWRLPEVRHGLVLGFASIGQALDAMRRVVQSELRPAVVRVYDAEESQQRGKGSGIDATLPILAILEFSGSVPLAALERDLALQIVERFGAQRLDEAPYTHWLAHRYESYSPQWQAGGSYMDTIEVTASWRALPALYARIREGIRGLGDNVYFGTHWSHVYTDGACQYMTFRLPPMPREEALRLHRQAWDVAQRACLESGGSISHHHGVGVFRNPWLREELGVGLELLQHLKDALDPNNLFVPGKVALRQAAGAVDLEAGEQP